MKYEKFIEECKKRTIDPELALENDLIVHYLATRQDDLVCRILDQDY